MAYMEPECKISSTTSRRRYAIEKFMSTNRSYPDSSKEFITFGFLRIFRSFYIGASILRPFDKTHGSGQALRPFGLS